MKHTHGHGEVSVVLISSLEPLLSQFTLKILAEVEKAVLLL